MAINKDALKITYADKTAGSTVTHEDINQMKHRHNELVDNSFLLEQILQTTGQSLVHTMSQDAITKELNKKLGASDIVQTVGGELDTALTKTPSQKALTEAIKTKLDTTVFNTYFENI